MQEKESNPQQDEYSDEKSGTWHSRFQNSVFTFLTIAASILFFPSAPVSGKYFRFFPESSDWNQPRHMGDDIRLSAVPDFQIL